VFQLSTSAAATAPGIVIKMLDMPLAFQPTLIKIKVGDSAADRQKAWEAWRDKIGKQKETVESLQKDTEQMEKANQLRMNTYMGSGQSRIYGGAQEAKAELDIQAQVEKKKKEIDDAKKTLDDMQEEARRAGVPSSFRD